VLARYAGVTDPGRRRRRNEDAYVAEPPLFAIADGMGGAQAGEVASGLAAAVLEEATGDEHSEVKGEERVASLIMEANRRVFQRSHEDAATSGMGTTMTVALVDNSDGTIAFGHVGDSRAYRIRGGQLEQLTDDHSLVGELVRSGRLSPEEAETHPQRSVITRALGTEPDVDVDTFTTEAEPDDIYLLCSDGLTDMISTREILSVVEGSRDLDDAARSLIDAANAGGGEDNITVVLFQIDGATTNGDGGETARVPAAVTESAYEHDDDEDTLSPLDAVPAVDTAVIPAEAVREQLQQVEAERPAEPRRRLLPLVVLILLLVALVALAVWGLTR
jgi:serine/threonine protein phosphatase PrpC